MRKRRIFQEEITLPSNEFRSTNLKENLDRCAPFSHFFEHNVSIIETDDRGIQSEKSDFVYNEIDHEKNKTLT